MKTIRRISVSSAFKVGAVLAALLFIVIGFFIVLMPALFGASLLGAMLGNQGGASAFGAGAVSGVILYIVGTIVYAIVGGITGAIDAWLYNIVAGIVGGIEVELS